MTDLLKGVAQHTALLHRYDNEEHNYEHPTHTKARWRQAKTEAGANQDIGYWAWVQDRLDEEK